MSGHTVVMASGNPLSPSHTAMHTSATPAVTDLCQHSEPEFGALAAVAGPQSEDVAFPGGGNADGDVDRPVGDLPVSNFDVNGVDEHDWVHRVERARDPFGHLRKNLVGGGTSLHEVLGGILLIVSFDTVAPGGTSRLRGKTSSKWAAISPVVRPFCRQGQDDFVDAGQPSLSFLDDLRIEGSIGVTRDLDLDRADLREDRFRSSTVAGVPAVAARRCGRHTRSIGASTSPTPTPFGPSVTRMTQGLSGVGIGPIGRSAARSTRYR
ncbi:hypothetical protein R1CP_32305 [Rhodococcus opacus]|uniref:Uncharacterized protein n=1 Tax=Rhodococcus opacus TaxID=37919 RepID=A0A1B1KEN8_RHOOP|nr:hypothetical protein R1CP_32305 [Rhodococcus opacus]